MDILHFPYSVPTSSKVVPQSMTEDGEGDEKLPYKMSPSGRFPRHHSHVSALLHPEIKLHSLHVTNGIEELPLIIKIPAALTMMLLCDIIRFLLHNKPKRPSLSNEYRYGFSYWWSYKKLQ